MKCKDNNNAMGAIDPVYDCDCFAEAGNVFAMLIPTAASTAGRWFRLCGVLHNLLTHVCFAYRICLTVDSQATSDYVHVEVD